MSHHMKYIIKCGLIIINRFKRIIEVFVTLAFLILGKTLSSG